MGEREGGEIEGERKRGGSKREREGESESDRQT